MHRPRLSVTKWSDFRPDAAKRARADRPAKQPEAAAEVLRDQLVFFYYFSRRIKTEIPERRARNTESYDHVVRRATHDVPSPRVRGADGRASADAVDRHRPSARE